MSAIQYWSGYNYQGKVMLLVVLQALNQYAETEWAHITVEPEERQDFTIYDRGVPIDFYQAKANKNEYTWSEYRTDLEKMEQQHTVHNTARFHLCCASGVRNWDKATEFNDFVSLYKYNGQWTGVLGVIDHIKTELQIYAGKPENSVTYGEELYLALCAFLDTIVAEIHTDDRPAVGGVPLAEFAEKMKAGFDEREALERSRAREKTYTYVVQGLENAVDTVCTDCETKTACDTACSVNIAYSAFHGVADLFEAAHLLRPDKQFKQDDHIAYAQALQEEDFQEIYFEFFKEIDIAARLTLQDNVLQIRDPIFQVVHETLVPTLLEFRKASLQSKLTKIAGNVEARAKLNGKLLSAEMHHSTAETIESKSLKELSIVAYPETPTAGCGPQDSKKRIVPTLDDITLISNQRAKSLLQGGSKDAKA